MATQAEAAAKRERCPNCGMFKHRSKECPSLNRKVTTTPESRRATKNLSTNEWRKRNPEQALELARRYRNRVKERVFSHYSGGEIKCACCDIKGMIFLTLDHIDGDGAEKRRAAGSRGGVHYYRTLIQQGFPPGYQVLCFNCNVAKGIDGVCPHQIAA